MGVNVGVQGSVPDALLRQPYADGLAFAVGCQEDFAQELLEVRLLVVSGKLRVSRGARLGFVAAIDAARLDAARLGGKCELWRIPSAGGEEVQIIGARLGFQKFALVKDGVYFVEGNWRDPVCALQFHRLSTGRTERVGVIHRRLDTGLGVWPADQPRWLYSSGFDEPTGDLVLAESRP